MDQENNNSNVLKIATIVLAIITVAMAIFLIYIMRDRQGTIDQLGTEKVQLTTQLTDMRSQYDALQTNNDTLSAELTAEKQKIDILLEKIKKTDASNARKMKEYENELGTLRAIMRGYVKQIDSLNTLNQRLIVESKQARDEATDSRKKYDELVQKTDNLSATVQKGAQVKARDIMVTAINSRGKDIDRAKNTDKLKTCFTLIENTIAEKGIRKVYVRIKGPDGILLADSETNVFPFEGDQLVYSAMREVDYQGEDIDLCVFYGSGGDFAPGKYDVEIYSIEGLMGRGQILLK